MSAKLNVEIIGTDLDTRIAQYIRTNRVPYVEAEIERYLEDSKLVFVRGIEQVISNSDIVFVAVQTPHSREYEGVTPTPDTTRDFDYSYLESCISSIATYVKNSENKNLDVVIISTVLPGTIRSKILPLVAGTNINIMYNPYFIAMGTTINDFLNPEFTIIGTKDDSRSWDNLASIYKDILTCEILPMSYEEAELVKVSYNTFIGMKIVFANTLAEIVAKIGGNVDVVTKALSKATTRVLSEKYLSAGMGDGGGCHPRDQIAMSWLAKKLNLSVNLFEFLSKARDKQTKRHAELIRDKWKELDYPVVILGEAYKKDINLTVGSPSILLQYYLEELGVPFTVFDPVVYPEQKADFQGPHIFYVATPHTVFSNLALPLESRVLDPWRNSIKKQYSIRFEFLSRGEWG